MGWIEIAIGVFVGLLAWVVFKAIVGVAFDATTQPRATPRVEHPRPTTRATHAPKDDAPWPPLRVDRTAPPESTPCLQISRDDLPPPPRRK